MDGIELTKLFIEAAETKQRLEELELKIYNVIMTTEESQKIAGVKATYYKPGFATPDYGFAAERALPDDFDLEPYQTVRVTTKWKAVCDELGITGEVPPGKPKAARVTISYK